MQRDLRLNVPRQQLLEFDEAVDEGEGHLGSEHGVLAPADARIDLEDRVTGLLDGDRNDLADLRNILGRLIADDRDAAKADVVKLMQRGLHPDARREVRK